MKQKLLISAAFCGSVIWGSEYVGATCTPTPSCTQLGYTKTQSECSEDAIKCPFGNSYFCEEEFCKIGWIYYTDGTCSADIIGEKTALGVVVYIDISRKHGQVMSAWPIDENGYKRVNHVGINWAKYEYDKHYDILELTNYNFNTFAARDFDSCGNTDKILNDKRTTYPAAQATKLYAPTIETEGKWCLPAAGILTSIYNNHKAVQAGISKLGGVTYPECCTWSSTEYNSESAWYSRLVNTYGLFGSSNTRKSMDNSVRPVLEF